MSKPPKYHRLNAGRASGPAPRVRRRAPRQHLPVGLRRAARSLVAFWRPRALPVDHGATPAATL